MLDRLETLEAEMRKLKALPVIAKAIADAQAEQAKAQKAAEDAAAKQESPDEASQGQRSKQSATR